MSAEQFLPKLPDVGYLGDDVSYGYDSTDMRDYALEAVRAAIASQAPPAPGAPGQEAADDRKIVETYEKLHEGKLGAHWLWCVIEQIAAGVPEAEAFKSFGYYEAARCPCGYPTPCSKKVPVQFCKSSTNRAAVPPQSPAVGAADRWKAVVMLAHELDDEAQDITERNAYHFANRLRELAGLNGEAAPDELAQNLLAAALPPSGAGERS